MNVVSFPNLGISVEVHSTAFTVFGLDIKWYAVLICTGLLLALIFAMKKGPEFGVDFDHFFTPVAIGIIAAVIGARSYFVIFHFDLYRNNLIEIFNIRRGGLAIYGAIIGGILFGSLACKWKKIPIRPMVDMACIGFSIGQAFGRWGNFVNMEAYGCATSSDYLFGMTSGSIVNDMSVLTGTYNPNVLVHPCFLYESVWCALLAVGLLLYMKHRKFDGEITLLYLMLYGAERGIVEGLRMDSLYIGESGIRVSQLLSLILVPLCLGLLIFFYIRIGKKKKQDPDAIFLFRDSEASRLLLAEGDGQKDVASEEQQKSTLDIEAEDRVLDAESTESALDAESTESAEETKKP